MDQKIEKRGQIIMAMCFSYTLPLLFVIIMELELQLLA
jgi:hypothetical protein